MSHIENAREAVACLRAGAGLREVYGLVRALPDGFQWDWWDDGTELLLMRHPTIDRHWRAWIPAGGGSAADEQEITAAIVETLEAWVRYWEREQPDGGQATEDWQEATTDDWATWFDVSPRSVTNWTNDGKDWIKPAPSGKRGHYVVNHSHPEAEAKRLKAEKAIRKRRGS